VWIREATPRAGTLGPDRLILRSRPRLGMQRALVVVDDTDTHGELLRGAGELASGAGADLLLLSTLTEEEFEERYAEMEELARAEGMSYSDHAILESVQERARDLAADSLAGVDVDYETGAVVVEGGSRADEVIETAEREGCDHVFIVGRERSPTGKAIFGDVAQAVALNFDGPVTIRMA